MPEIIGFCNELCYDNRLIPLTKSKPGFGPVIQRHFVADAKCEGSTGSEKNKQEAEAIKNQVENALPVFGILLFSRFIFLEYF